MSEKVRLGGMALGNGVLVHGPHAWACAIRTEDGTLQVVARRKRLQASFDMESTRPEWALAYKFDIVVRGRNATPME